MTRFLFLFVFIFLFGLGALAIVSCTCADCPRDNDSDIPEQIIRAADQLIISKTGSQFFDNYIASELNESKLVPGGFFMTYRFYMPERPYVDEKITFGLDSTGVLLKDIPVTGIPDCAASPDNCSFQVDENDAIKIAEGAKLQKGIKDWGRTFMWNAEFNMYVWSIITTLKGNEGPDGFRGSGIEMIIDSNSGEILRQSEWNVR